MRVIWKISGPDEDFYLLMAYAISFIMSLAQEISL